MCEERNSPGVVCCDLVRSSGFLLSKFMKMDCAILVAMLANEHQSYINKKANSFRYLLFLNDSNNYPPAPGYPGFCTKFLFASSCDLGIGNKL